MDVLHWVMYYIKDVYNSTMYYNKGCTTLNDVLH